MRRLALPLEFRGIPGRAETAGCRSSMLILRTLLERKGARFVSFNLSLDSLSTCPSFYDESKQGVPPYLFSPGGPGPTETGCSIYQCNRRGP